jgi:hypothetical protein
MLAVEVEGAFQVKIKSLVLTEEPNVSPDSRK